MNWLKKTSLAFKYKAAIKKPTMTRAMQKDDLSMALYLFKNNHFDETDITYGINFLIDGLNPTKPIKDSKTTILLINEIAKHDYAKKICSSVVASLLHSASIKRNNDVVQALITLPTAINIGQDSINNALLYALEENNPRIKEIDCRKINYDFGTGAPELLKTLEDFNTKRIAHNENIKKASPQRKTARGNGRF